MSTTVDQIRSKVMGLSSSERASLAHDLILSLDTASDLDLGSEHEQEIQRRVQLVRKGKAEGRPASAVFADIRAKRRSRYWAKRIRTAGQ
jgi:putative addiction module component (TIGR02574 family)